MVIKENNMKGVSHYKKNGKLYKGKTHKTNGKLMTGAKHTASSEYLTHTKPKGKKEMKKKKSKPKGY